MRKDAKTYIRECDICQHNKSKNLKPAGLLQPLPIPKEAWVDISMHFMDGVPTSKGYNVIMLIIDTFSKYSPFIPLSHPYTMVNITQQFMKCIFKLHGIPHRYSIYQFILKRDFLFEWHTTTNELSLPPINRQSD